MCVQLIRHNSMNNRKLVIYYYLKESFNKFHWINYRKWVIFFFCLLKNITSCPTTDSKYISILKQTVVKKNRMYVIPLWNVNSLYEKLWQKIVSGIVVFFTIHHANSMLKEVSHAYHFATGESWHILLFYRLWVIL